jgi:N-methylhydantoinase B/oxoprolinase/acetone carboxylase alpha subunit
VQTHGQNTENALAEETEANCPVRITLYESVPDSDGAGRQRGGLGLRRAVREGKVSAERARTVYGVEPNAEPKREASR